MKVGTLENPEMARISQDIKGTAVSKREEVGVETAAQKQPEQAEMVSVLGREVTQEETEQMIEVINDAMEIMDYNLQFRVHRETNRVIVKVVEPDTEKVIREMPPESMLDFIAKFRDMVGVLLDAKA